jgi:tripartite-type tricarboxylate transporter receptor subunit TctC
MKHLRYLLVTAIAAAWTGAAVAQAYPSKPVRMVAPFAAGGAVDVVARGMAQVLTAATGQPFVVENKPGAGGLIALETVAKSPPDGYTLAVGGNGPLSMSPHLYKDIKFDTLARLDPIIWFSTGPGIMLVRNDLKANSVSELVALSKATPGGLTMGSGGSGSLPHLMGENFQAGAGIKWVHVPFKGGAPALTELVAGRIDVLMDVVATAAPFVRSGKMRALAVTTLKRSAQMPELPTLDELGYKGFNMSSEVSLLAPKGTPKEVIARINAELNKSLRTDEIKARLAGIGAEGEGGTPEYLGERIRTELDRWGQVIRNANVSVQ